MSTFNTQPQATQPVSRIPINIPLTPNTLLPLPETFDVRWAERRPDTAEHAEVVRQTEQWMIRIAVQMNMDWVVIRKAWHKPTFTPRGSLIMDKPHITAWVKNRNSRLTISIHLYCERMEDQNGMYYLMLSHDLNGNRITGLPATYAQSIHKMLDPTPNRYPEYLDLLVQVERGPI